MQVEVYADVVFFINLIMDFIIFMTVSKLAKTKVTYKRLFFGSITGAALYCTVIFIPLLNRVYNFFGAIAILMISIMVTFKPKNIKEMFKLLIFSHIAAFAIGGAGMAFFYYTDLSSVIGNKLSFSIANFPFKILLISSAISYIVIKLSLGWIKSIFGKTKLLCDINIHFDNKHINLNALVDTGNSLCDPVTKEPVIVAEFEVLKTFLPDSMKLIYYEGKENDLSTFVTNIDCTKLKIRMIPFTSLGVKNGMLIGFKPDSVEIFTDKDKMTLKNIIIAIYNYNISKDGTYQALINPEIFERAVETVNTKIGG